MGFEPTTLRDLDHGGSWVQIPSGTRIFSESSFLLTINVIIFSMVVISLPMTSSLHVLTRFLLRLQIFDFSSDL